MAGPGIDAFAAGLGVPACLPTSQQCLPGARGAPSGEKQIEALGGENLSCSGKKLGVCTGMGSGAHCVRWVNRRQGSQAANRRPLHPAAHTPLPPPAAAHCLA